MGVKEGLTNLRDLETVAIWPSSARSDGVNPQQNPGRNRRSQRAYRAAAVNLGTRQRPYGGIRDPVMHVEEMRQGRVYVRDTRVTRSEQEHTGNALDERAQKELEGKFCWKGGGGTGGGRFWTQQKEHKHWDSSKEENLKGKCSDGAGPC